MFDALQNLPYKLPRDDLSPFIKHGMDTNLRAPSGGIQIFVPEGPEKSLAPVQGPISPMENRNALGALESRKLRFDSVYPFAGSLLPITHARSR